jgi:hypothetical protein
MVEGAARRIESSAALLGSRMHSFGVVLRGNLSEQQWLCMLHDLTEGIGMHAAGAPAVWHYPMHGKGGSGITYVLPITESFLALDTWPDHDGAYLFICSCRPFDILIVDAVAGKWSIEVSHEEKRRFYSELNLQ